MKRAVVNSHRFHPSGSVSSWGIKEILLVWVAGALLLVPMCGAQEGSTPGILGQFDPGAGQLVSIGYDTTTATVWVYDSFGDFLLSYSPTGVFISSIPHPGDDANDVDIDFTSHAFTLNGTAVPADSLLFVDGESGTADIFAVDSATGSEIASLATAFGTDHVVGGAYHPGRGTVFLVADRLDPVTPSTIAEIDPATGNVLNSFATTDHGYEVNFGDIDIDPSTGRILVVSNAENTILELTATGSFVQELSLPAGVSSLSGVGVVEDMVGEVFVSGTGGDVWHLGGVGGCTIFCDGFESGTTSAWSGFVQ